MIATEFQSYTSTNPEVNELPPIYREAVDDILYEFWSNCSEQEAKKDLKQIIELLTKNLNK